MLNQAPEGVVWAIMLLPLGSFAVISLVSLLGLTASAGGGPASGGSGRWSARYSGYLTVASIAAAFLLSLWVLDSAIDADGARFGFGSHQWVAVEPLRVNIGLTVDGLTARLVLACRTEGRRSPMRKTPSCMDCASSAASVSYNFM